MRELGGEFSIRHLCLALAFGVYALFSSPTPDVFSAAELTVFILLLLSVRFNLFALNGVGQLFALYGFSVPIIMALVQGQDQGLMLRDVVPFVFLLLPLLFSRQGDREKQFLSWGVAFIGVVFALRSLWAFGPRLMMPSLWLGEPPDLLYLANSPEVLFSGIFLMASALNTDNKILSRLLFFACALVTIVAMAAVMQRASLAYLAIVAVFVIGGWWWGKPKKALVYSLMAAVLVVVLWPLLQGVMAQLSFKHQMVGLNSRSAEFQAVLAQITTSPVYFLFGMGWGAEFENPAVGALRVGFTHSLVTALLLKTGLVGLIFFFVYGFFLLGRAWPVVRGETTYLFALAGPLLIGLFFYASYKSLGYGFLLLILSKFSREGQKA